MYNVTLSLSISNLIMNIFLNGDTKQIENNLLLSELIEQLGFAGKRLAVEINKEIVPKSEHGSYTIQDGDRIEIVHAIGGG